MTKDSPRTFGFAAILCIAALIACSGPMITKAKECAMYDTILNLTKVSEVVALTRVRGSADGLPTPAGEEFLRFTTEVVTLFKGTVAGTLVVKIPSQGKETPTFVEGATYLLFLRAASDASGDWSLVDLSSPVAVGSRTIDPFKRHFAAYMDIAADGGDTARMKSHILQVLESGIPFLQNDASSEALRVFDWDQTELTRLIGIAANGAQHGLLPSIARENITTVILSLGAPEKVTVFAATEIAAGNGDAVYFGLDERKVKGTNKILGALLAHDDPAVKLGAIRIVGLLRREDILDTLAKKYQGSGDAAVLDAIGEARALAKRD